MRQLRGRLLRASGQCELRRDARRGTQVSLAMIDVDHFKQVNDERGHAAGDQVLQEIVESIRSGLRDRDVLVPLGGDEFVLLLPPTDLDAAKAAGERIRPRAADNQGLPGLSIGVVQWAGEGLADLISRADDAMYRAKQAGRNTVVAVADRPEGRRAPAPRQASGEGPRDSAGGQSRSAGAATGQTEPTGQAGSRQDVG